LIFSAIAATGAGLHVAAFFIEDQTHISGVATVLCVAVPVGAFVLTIYALYTYLLREADPFHLSLLAGTAAVLVAAVWLAAGGVPMAWCLLVVTPAPAVTVVGYEALGCRRCLGPSGPGWPTEPGCGSVPPLDSLYRSALGARRLPAGLPRALLDALERLR
jgi:hypothetical protein